MVSSVHSTDRIHIIRSIRAVCYCLILYYRVCSILLAHCARHAQTLACNTRIITAYTSFYTLCFCMSQCCVRSGSHQNRRDSNNVRRCVVCHHPSAQSAQLGLVAGVRHSMMPSLDNALCIYLRAIMPTNNVCREL